MFTFEACVALQHDSTLPERQTGKQPDRQGQIDWANRQTETEKETGTDRRGTVTKTHDQTN